MSRTLERSRPRTNWGRVLVVFLGLILTGVLIFLTLSRYFAVTEIRLPNLIGLSREDADKILADLKLEPVFFSEDISDAIVNAVSSQSPQAGTIVRQGRSVAVGINRPELRITMPSVIDMSLSNASTMINNLGLDLAEVSYQYSDLEAGRILAQEPLVGAVASISTKVSLVISRGPEAFRTTMPNLKGLTIDAAKSRLRDLGVSRIETTSAGISFDKPGLITAQVPEAGGSVTQGTHVILSAPLSTQAISQVPQLNGIPLSQVQMQLNAAGLRIGAVTYISDPAQSPGVVSFKPSGYTLRDTPVEVVVNQAGLAEPITNLSVAPAPSSPTPAPSQVVTPPPNPSPGQPSSVPTPTPNSTSTSTPQISAGQTTTTTPSSSPTSPTTAASSGSRQVPITFNPAELGIPSLMEQSYKFKLMIADDQGERTVVERIVSPGEPVSANVTIYGEGTVRTYINDLLYEAWKP